MLIRNFTSDTLYVGGFPLESERSIRIPCFNEIIISSRTKGTSVLTRQDDNSIRITYDLYCTFILAEGSSKELIAFVNNEVCY